jgi:hypothetical protein
VDFQKLREQRSKHLTLRSSLYHRKAIEVQMFKMGSYDPFGHLQHKLWQKELLGVKIGNLIPNHKKSRIDPTFVCAGGVRHAVWKALDESCNFASDLIPIGGLSMKL